MVRSQSPPPYSERIWGLSPARGRQYRSKRKQRRGPTPDGLPSSSVDSEDDQVRGRSMQKHQTVSASLKKKSTYSGRDMLVPVAFDDTDDTSSRQASVHKAPASTRSRSQSRPIPVRSRSQGRQAPTRSFSQTQPKSVRDDSSRKRMRSLSRSRPELHHELASDLVSTLNSAFGYAAAPKAPPPKRLKRDASRSRIVETSDQDEEELRIVEPRATSSRTGKLRRREKEMSPEIPIFGTSPPRNQASTSQRKPSSLYLKADRSGKDERGRRLLTGTRYFIGKPPPSRPSFPPVAETPRPRPVAPISSYAARLVPGPTPIASSSRSRIQAEHDQSASRKKLVNITVYEYPATKASSRFIKQPTATTQSARAFENAGRKSSAEDIEDSISNSESDESHYPPLRMQRGWGPTTPVVAGQSTGQPKRTTVWKSPVKNGTRVVIDLSDVVGESTKSSSYSLPRTAKPMALPRGRPTGPPKHNKSAKSAIIRPRSDSVSSIDSDQTTRPRNTGRITTTAVRPVVSQPIKEPSTMSERAKGKQREQPRPDKGRETLRVSSPHTQPESGSASNIQPTNGEIVVNAPQTAVQPAQLPSPTKTGRPRGRPRKYIPGTKTLIFPKTPTLPRADASVSAVPNTVQSAGQSLTTASSAISASAVRHLKTTHLVPNAITAAGMDSSGWYLDPVTFQWRANGPLVVPPPALVPPSTNQLSSAGSSIVWFPYVNSGTLPLQSVPNPLNVLTEPLSATTPDYKHMQQSDDSRPLAPSAATHIYASPRVTSATAKPNNGKQPQAQHQEQPSGSANVVNGPISTPMTVLEHVSADVAIHNTPVLNGTKTVDLVNHKEPKLPLTEFQRREYLCTALAKELQQAASASRRPMFAGSFKELADPRSDILLLLHEIAMSVSAKVGLTFRTDLIAATAAANTGWSHSVSLTCMCSPTPCGGTTTFFVDGLPNLYRGARSITFTVEINH